MHALVELLWLPTLCNKIVESGSIHNEAKKVKTWIMIEKW